MSLYSEIKKYLLYLVGFFCLLLLGHVIFLYLYSDAEVYPLNGGTLTIGVVGESTDLNILGLDTRIENTSADIAVRFLFRGLIRYSLNERKIVGDLMRCNLDTFPNIRCTLNQDALWNDGTAVSVEDILGTYQFFKDNTTNTSLKARLNLVTVSEDK